MKDLFNLIWGGREEGSSRNKGDRDMTEVMRRVDDQIGRAVTRLSER